MSFKSIIRKIVPERVYSMTSQYVSLFLFKQKVKKVRKEQIRIVEEIKVKDKIKVAFFLINVDTWKLDSLYSVFEKSERYEPIVIICPFITKGENFMLKELKKGVEFSIKSKYNYLLAYNESESTVIDVKKRIKPDIIFFTNPNNLTYKEFLIYNFLDKLTCYVPYSFRIDRLYQYEYNHRLVNLVWLNFYESNIHKKLSEKFAINKGENVRAPGFPFLDRYLTVTKEQVWKNADKKRKKIIWAPHWTIKNHQETGLDWSCFLDYSQFILDLAVEFKEEVQFALKPHPLLKPLLSQKSLWGEGKTNIYFDKWDTLENCQYVDGDYKALFEQSDALIHDSGSFMTEYIALNKPVAYTVSDKPIENRFNEFGDVVLLGHELIYSKVDFRKFVKDLINNFDELKEKREKIIIQQQLRSKELVGEKIFKIINNKLK
jgi:hypothetical protein